ncbi:MAG: NAD(+) synthase, partial [Clostridiaceae bacterium]|nr:NAD(+) synthase [Clostridiaceae bacterium]
AQKTEDIVGPYELHDFFLYYFMKQGASRGKILFLAKEAFKDVYTEEEIINWLDKFIKRFFTQQFKRSALPDGPKVGTISVSPRGDLRMPSDASFNSFL